jgi:hypothetical protein
MERKEYLLSELPVELRDAAGFASMGMGLDSMSTVGFTLDGVRYRVYRNERRKAAAKALGIDLMDALKGANVPAEEIAAAMDKLAMDPTDRDVILADIASLKVNKRAEPATDISI